MFRTTGLWFLSQERGRARRLQLGSPCALARISLLPFVPRSAAGRGRTSCCCGRIGREAPDESWSKESSGRWQLASVFSKPWAKVRAQAGLDKNIVPYALRHSSIVRGLRAGLPVRLVAALHDTSTPMIEKHYSAFIVDAMDELAAKAIVPLATPPVTHIRPIEHARK
jgi:integrase